jgi:hypothetical protein
MGSIDPVIDAELNQRGVAAVAAMLPLAVGSNRGATVKLWVTGVPDPDRGYVEDWLGRKEAEDRATSARRHQEVTKPAHDAATYAWWSVIVGTIAAVAGLVAAVLSAIPLFK